jgi:DNA-directed RNA polymerase subunit F
MRARTLGVFAGAAILALAMAPAAKAQGFMRGGGGMAALGALTTPEGQKELGLSDEQVGKVQELMQNNQATMRERFQDLQGLGQDEMREKMQSMMKEMSASTKTKLKDILKPEQLKRYDEISLQAMGVDAFSDDEVTGKLKLTDDQKKKLADLQEDTQEEIRSAFQDAQGGGDRQALGRKMREIRDQAREKALTVLTDEQKATWKEMTGKPFQFPMGGGPGGGQRRRPID